MKKREEKRRENSSHFSINDAGIHRPTSIMDDLIPFCVDRLIRWDMKRDRREVIYSLSDIHSIKCFYWCIRLVTSSPSLFYCILFSSIQLHLIQFLQTLQAKEFYPGICILERYLHNEWIREMREEKKRGWWITHTPNLILSGTPTITVFSLLPLTRNLILLSSLFSVRRSASILTSSPFFASFVRNTVLLSELSRYGSEM